MRNGSHIEIASASRRVVAALTCAVLGGGVVACGGPIDEAPGKALDWAKRLRPKQGQRPCHDHEECFGGEHCASSGFCEPYQRKTRAFPTDDPDLSAYAYDLGQEGD